MLALGCVAVVLVEVGSWPGSSSKSTVTTLVTTHPAGAVHAAEVAACHSSYEAVQTAVDEFEAETGTGPTSRNSLYSFCWQH